MPKPRKDVQIALVEYGAAGKWKDVTALVNGHLVCGMLSLRGTNVLFGGDPAPGIPKSIIATYTVDDEDKMLEVPENGVVNIQFDPKNFFYRLTPKTDGNFRFRIENGK